jgi:hypothetical protein
MALVNPSSATEQPPTPHDDHDDFGGLSRDLPALLPRRRILQLLGGVGFVFGDDQAVHQLATISGSPTSGIVAALSVPV